MTFLHPILLAGLALTVLPIVIHLINQLRYRTIRWGAMMFLLQANRMSRGLARLRQWLILLMRMLAIGCLVFVISRPLASGWMGWLTAGDADTTIILLDRSPSMLDSSSGRSKLVAARRQLAEALARFSSKRWVLIESVSAKPRELESPAALERLPEAGATSAAADLPTMLAAARDYVVANQAGRTEVWICSDLRANDWNSDDARWSKLRSSFAGLPQPVRFHLLAYSQPPQGDLAVRVTTLRHRKLGDEAELLVSLRLTRQGNSADAVTVPVQFEIGGARSALNVEIAGTSVEVRDHRIALDRQHLRGWGKVSIPADTNASDNEYYFAFDTSQSARTAVVSDDREVAETLRLAASIAPDPSSACSADVFSTDQQTAIEWGSVALVLWQAPLPEGEALAQLAAFIERGGQIIFFPPRQTNEQAAFGVRWDSWTPVKDDAVIDRWRGDEDLLANTQSGEALPIGKLKLKNVCSLAGDMTSLATLRSGTPVFARASTPGGGGVYFCATTPAAGDSNLASEGVVFYVAVQRALAAGAAALGSARQVVADAKLTTDAAAWQKLAGSEGALSSEYAVQAGAYSGRGVLMAVNRPEEEDVSSVLADERVAGLFEGLDFTRIDQVASSERSLVEELWRPFLTAMMIALLVEAWLCLPRPTAETVSPLGRTEARPFAFG
ncbi:MAG TPA: BatA domain-containing protein [Pirellulales bacterium]|nr:BatA domain-containing protein [Pirellulales bacterium]